MVRLKSYPAVQPGLTITRDAFAHVPEWLLHEEDPLFGLITGVRVIRGGAVKVSRENEAGDQYFYRSHEILREEEPCDPYTGRGGTSIIWSTGGRKTGAHSSTRLIDVLRYLNTKYAQED